MKTTKKRQSVGERIAEWFKDDTPQFVADTDPLARRIDRSVSAAVRKERERCAEIVNKRLGADTQATKGIIDMLLSGK